MIIAFMGYDRDFHRVQNKRYEPPARYFGIQIIDTSKPLEETLDQVTEGVLASALSK